MDLADLDISTNENSIHRQDHIESVLLYGSPDAVPDADITICIPTCKRPHLLKEALESALNQDTVVPYRVVVIDNDDNFDATEVLDMIRSLDSGKILYYKNRENLGMFGNWNRCALLARTRYFSLLHDDDLLFENYIEDVAAILKKHKNINGLIVGGINNLPQPHERKGLAGMFRQCYCAVVSLNKLVKVPISAILFFWFGQPTCGMLYKKDVFIESGGYNPAYYPSADGVFFLYFLKRYGFYRYKEICSVYRFIENDSEKPEVKQGIKNYQRMMMCAISKTSLFCGVLYKIFQKDLEKTIAVHYDRVKLRRSFLFKIILYLYNIHVGTIRLGKRLRYERNVSP